MPAHGGSGPPKLFLTDLLPTSPSLVGHNGSIRSWQEWVVGTFRCFYLTPSFANITNEVIEDLLAIAPSIEVAGVSSSLQTPSCKTKLSVSELTHHLCPLYLHKSSSTHSTRVTY